MLIVESDISCN